MQYLNVGGDGDDKKPRTTSIVQQHTDRKTITIALLSILLSAIAIGCAIFAMIQSGDTCTCNAGSSPSSASSVGVDHEWVGTMVRFRQSNGSFGEFVDLSGPMGAPGNRTYEFSVRDCGALGDGQTDDAAAIQRCVYAAAASRGSMVHFPVGTYLVRSPILVPGGVNLVGEGIGANPLAHDNSGSVILVCGDHYGLVIQGHAAGARDLTLYDWDIGSCVESQGGVLLDADGVFLESVYFANVLIYRFLSGTALHLRAQTKDGSSGAIAYGLFFNVRIRHAKVQPEEMRQLTSE